MCAVYVPPAVTGNRRLGRFPLGWHVSRDPDKESVMAEAGWVRVATVSDVAEGQVHAVRVGEREIALYHLPGGEYRATDNICTHEYAQLSDGWLEDGCIECPLHAARFDVRSGKALCAPAEQDIDVFEIRVEGNDLLVNMPG
jgi:nitrite reductase/ring-hydroxylating ferredoxin subunit